MTLLLFVWLLNFVISAWNAYAVGWSWVEAKAAGGWIRILAWAGATMSACGFTWCYLVIVTLVGAQTEYLDQEAATAVFKLGYLLIILPILGSGLALWAESLARAWRERTLLSVGVAGWNSFAQVYNTYQAVTAIPEFLGDLGEFFSERKSSKDDAKGAMAMLVIVLAVLALIGGIVTTASIVRWSARSSATYALNEARELKTKYA